MQKITKLFITLVLIICVVNLFSINAFAETIIVTNINFYMLRNNTDNWCIDVNNGYVYSATDQFNIKNEYCNEFIIVNDGISNVTLYEHWGENNNTTYHFTAYTFDLSNYNYHIECRAGSKEIFITKTDKACEHIFVERVTKEPTCDSDGIKEIYCEKCGYIQGSLSVSSFGYSLDYYADEIDKASNKEQPIVFDFGVWNSFPKWFMEKIAANNNKSYIFKYKWNNEQQSVTIPRGTIINLDCEWFGPAKMKELYGGYQ